MAITYDERELGPRATTEAEPRDHALPTTQAEAIAGDHDEAGYYGLPIVLPPVWTWQIPTYFFIGGLSGMAAVLACAALFVAGDPALVTAAMALAGVGAVLAPVLLAWDLGRPARFLYMLRVFKWRSPMSVGSWIVTCFGAAALPALALCLLYDAAASPSPLLTAVRAAAIASAALFGALLATYTAVLIGATVIPAWSVHRTLLPVHFGAAGLGSAAAALELLGFTHPALNAVAYVAIAVEIAIALRLELAHHGVVDRPTRHGKSGWLIRSGGLATGPLALLLRLVGWRELSALAFLLGAALSRFGWHAAGPASANDPRATLALQRR